MIDFAGINVIWKGYSVYPGYFQQNRPFDGKAAIIILILNTEDRSSKFIEGWYGSAVP